MTPEEQQQVNAAMGFLQRQLANTAAEGANVSSTAESLAMQLKAAREEIETLKQLIAAKQAATE